MIPVILSGGSGTRLWPVSRSKVPKQFCEIFQESLQTLSLKRTLALGNPLILTSADLKDHTEKHLDSFRKAGGLAGSAGSNNKSVKALYEPEARNTAPALAYLSLTLAKQGLENEICVVLPSDHLIEDEDAFQTAVHLAAQEASKGFLVVLGIHPTSPATGYGYIETRKTNGSESRAVVKFYEKPSLEKAQQFVADGNFYWNAGMFVFTPRFMLELMSTYAPEVIRPFDELKSDLSNLKEVYQKTKKVSIDYAVIEKLGPTQLKCIPADIGWNDVGSWDSVADIFAGKDGATEVIEAQAHNNYVHSKTKKTYAFAGVEDLILVDTPDAILVTKRGATQSVKEVTEKLKRQNVRCADYLLNEERPWGSFEVLKDTDRFKSKILTVEPGSQISYQSHNQREEHWMIVEGHGEVILNDEVLKVSPGAYVKIPLKAKHRVRNTGTENILIVEVQMGAYFGEDDIIRYQDEYRRI